MLTELSKIDLICLLQQQVGNLFTITTAEKDVVAEILNDVLVRTEYCFSKSANKYYSKNGETYFSPFHSGQYAIYLYFFSNEIHRRYGAKFRNLADKIYYLNKTLNSLDLFYEVEMPKAFFLDHPLGSVIGRATYGEGFSFTQGCTVGNNNGEYPVFGENVAMLSNSKVIGRCAVGSHVVFAANSYAKDIDVPSHSIVFGQSPNHIIKPAMGRPI